MTIDGPTDAGRMARAEIRSLYARYAEQERTLLARVIALEKAGGAASFPDPALEHEQKARARARLMLNGHSDKLLAPPRGLGGGSLAEIRVELDETQNIMRALTKAGLEAEAVEALERVEQQKPAWEALVRKQALRMAAVAEGEAEAQKFLETVGYDVAIALPMSLFVGSGATAGRDVADFLAAAVAEGIVTEAEIRKAKHAKG